MLRFVRPDTTTLQLKDGESITIRKRLNAGERRAMYSRMYRQDSSVVDPMKVFLATITAYLLDWSAKDDSGNRVAISHLSTDELESVLNSLDPDSFAEIATAIDAYADLDADARNVEKKDPVGATAS